MKPAPIALFVFNRPLHARKVVEALQNNNLSAASDLIVYSDGPRTAADNTAVNEVRSYIRSISGFRSVTLMERTENYGCAKSIVSGVTETVNRFGRIIVVEDDVLTAPHFLEFMNDALELYQHDKEVICIHGYLYPVTVQLPETFFIRGADIWGWATWKRGWDLYECDCRKLLQEVKEKKLVRELKSIGYLGTLENQIDGKTDTWDIQWYLSARLNDLLTLYPGKSLVENIGYDNSGTHCLTNDLFAVELSSGPVTVTRIPLEEDNIAAQAIGAFLMSVRSSPLKNLLTNTKLLAGRIMFRYQKNSL